MNCMACRNTIVVTVLDSGSDGNGNFSRRTVSHKLMFEEQSELDKRKRS